MARLTAENESLMDISNALSAEKRQAIERLEAAAKAGKLNILVLVYMLFKFPDAVKKLLRMSANLFPAWTLVSDRCVSRSILTQSHIRLLSLGYCVDSVVLRCTC